MHQILSLRQLNRTTLQRQRLLHRADHAVLQATAQVVAWQSQIPNPPYIGLWTRLTTFAKSDLTSALENRQIVRAPLMRSTLHLITAEDHQALQAALQPALDKGLSSFFGRYLKGLDPAPLLTAVKPYLEQAPRSTGDLKAFLSPLAPDRDADGLAYLVRTMIPQVQVPPSGTWGSGSRATYTTAEHWLGAPPQPPNPRLLFERYLAAFGPASVMDYQTWTGMTKLKEQIEAWRGDLVVYRDDNGTELFDLPHLPLTDENTPSPVRFIPEYDNLMIGHANRNRVLPDEHYKKVFLSAARVRNTFLVDGFVAGTWRTKRKKTEAALVIEPFAPLSPPDEAALMDEAQRLIAFIEDTADSFTVRVETIY